MSKKKNTKQLKLEEDQLQLAAVQKELKKRREELMKLEQEAETDKKAIQSQEDDFEHVGMTFTDIIKESGIKEKVLVKRLHITTPTFTARKRGGASLWRMDEVKTIALRLGVSPLDIFMALLPEVNIIPEDKEEARILRESYSRRR
jgi:hypothetical protein